MYAVLRMSAYTAYYDVKQPYIAEGGKMAFVMRKIKEELN